MSTMLAAAVLWIAFQADIAAPDLAICRGWSISAVGAAAFQPLFTYPNYDNGLKLSGGFRFNHPIGNRMIVSVTGRAGATRIDDWRPIFEAGLALDGLPAGIEIRGGARHDDRLAREGRLRDFRDPTGRLFLGASAWPFRRGAFGAGAMVEYERAMPGEGRLPSAISGRVAARMSWPLR
jgi:hypothetical protein